MSDVLRPARWGLMRSAAYGVLFGAVVAALALATSVPMWSPAFWIGTIAGQALFGVVLFVVVAAIRNAVLRAR